MFRIGSRMNGGVARGNVLSAATLLGNRGKKDP
jgi:hypothetical protein